MLTLNQVIAAQTRLAQELRRRPEFRELYLTELLNLFVDKGVAIQNAYISNHHYKVNGPKIPSPCCKGLYRSTV